MSKLTLFELTAEIENVIDEIVDAEIARDTETLDGLYAELEALYDARESKQIGYVHVVKNADIAAKACQAQANAFYARAKALENIARRLKDNLHQDLIHHGEKSATAGKFKIARQNGTARVVLNIPPEELPADYQRVSIEADKTALKDALKDGTEIDGVALEPTEHIRIRVR